MKNKINHSNRWKLYFLPVAVCTNILCLAQIGIKTDNSEASFDVRAINHLNTVDPKDGVLVPRVNNLTANGSVDGQMVYLIADQSGVTQGFYYWDAPSNTWKPAGGTAADSTKDTWIDDPANGYVKLGTKSTGTARDAGTDFVALDNGNVGIGNSSPLVRLDVRTNPGNNNPGTGIISIGGTSVTAGAAGAGALRYYESSGGQLHHSDGAVWYALHSNVKKVSIVAKKNGAQTFGDGQLTNVINWNTIADVTGNFTNSTGVFTAPRDGNYAMSFSFNFLRATLIDGSQVEAQLIVDNGAQFKKSIIPFPKGGQSQAGASVSFVLKLNAGQTVRPAIYQFTGSDKTLRIGTGNDDGFVNFSVAEL